MQFLTAIHTTRGYGKCQGDGEFRRPDRVIDYTTVTPTTPPSLRRKPESRVCEIVDFPNKIAEFGHWIPASAGMTGMERFDAAGRFWIPASAGMTGIKLLVCDCPCHCERSNVTPHLMRGRQSRRRRERRRPAQRPQVAQTPEARAEPPARASLTRRRPPASRCR